MNRLQKMFPEGVIKYQDASNGSFEVNGLKAGTVPQTGELIVSGEEKLRTQPKDRRTHFVILLDERTIARFRVCTAMAGSGYDEYATGWIRTFDSKANYDEYLTHALEAIEILSGK